MFQQMSHGGNGTATGLLLRIKQFNFVTACLVLQKCFSLSRHASEYLQNEGMDLFTAVVAIQDIKVHTKQCAQKTSWTSWFPIQDFLQTKLNPRCLPRKLQLHPQSDVVACLPASVMVKLLWRVLTAFLGTIQKMMVIPLLIAWDKTFFILFDKLLSELDKRFAVNHLQKLEVGLRKSSKKLDQNILDVLTYTCEVVWTK